MGIILNLGTGGPSLKSETIGGDECELIKLGTGAVGVFNPVSNAFPIPISDAGSSLTVDPAGGSFSIDDGGNSLSIDDGGNRLTVITGSGIKLLHDGISETAVLHVTFDENTAGAYEVIPALANKTFVMTHLVLVAAGEVRIRFVTITAAPVPTSGWIALAKNVGMVIPYASAGWSESAPDENWGIELEQSQQVGGVVYGARIAS